MVGAVTGGASYRLTKSDFVRIFRTAAIAPLLVIITFPMVGLIVLVLCYAAMIIIAAPAYLLLRPIRHKVTLSIALAAAVGLTVALICLALLDYGWMIRNVWPGAAYIGLNGAAVGGIFRVVAWPVWGKPSQ